MHVMIVQPHNDRSPIDVQHVVVGRWLIRSDMRDRVACPHADDSAGDPGITDQQTHVTKVRLPAMLDLFATGASDVLGVLDGEPIVFVDLDHGWSEVPPLFPAVVVGVGSGNRGDVGADVGLTTMTDAPAPWVTVDDLDAGCRELEEAVRSNPTAAVTLVQLLRMSSNRAIDLGLAMESLSYSVLQGGPEFAHWRATHEYRPRVETEPPAIVEVVGDEIQITLNRPQVHNAYNRAMRDALCEALGLAAADPSFSVTIRGNGPSFCSGGDLTEFGTFPDSTTAHLVRINRSPARLISLLSARVRVEVHGACVGSGIELPAFAGQVAARTDTLVSLPEISMGLIPGAGGTASLPRRIGAARTAWLALSGRTIDAATALAWGLVDRLV
jgi:hypothetical protein